MHAQSPLTSSHLSILYCQGKPTSKSYFQRSVTVNLNFFLPTTFTKVSSRWVLTLLDRKQSAFYILYFLFISRSLFFFHYSHLLPLSFLSILYVATLMLPHVYCFHLCSVTVCLSKFSILPNWTLVHLSSSAETHEEHILNF